MTQGKSSCVHNYRTAQLDTNTAAQWRKRQPQQRNTTFATFLNAQLDRVRGTLAAKYGEADESLLLADVSESTWNNIYRECSIESRGNTRGCQSSGYGLPRVVGGSNE